jgi:hypothetical protein
LLYRAAPLKWSELTEVTDTVVLGPLSDEFLNTDVGKGVIRFLPWRRVVK